MSGGEWIGLIYLAGCIFLFLPLARGLVRSDLCDDPPSTADLWTSGLMAVLCIWFWPLIIPVYYVVQVLKNERSE